MYALDHPHLVEFIRRVIFFLWIAYSWYTIVTVVGVVIDVRQWLALQANENFPPIRETAVVTKTETGEPLSRQTLHRVASFCCIECSDGHSSLDASNIICGVRRMMSSPGSPLS